MTKITVDVLKKEVRLSKTAYNTACRVGTSEYNELQKILQMHPDYEVVVDSSKSNKDLFKFLTFDYMEEYIKAHDDSEQKIMNEYKDLRGLSEAAKEMGAVSYTLPQMKEWFLEKFPAVRDYHLKRDENRKKLSEQRKTAMTRKAA